MKQYNEEIATNPAVEMIHASLDRDKKAAESWAAKEGFPWPTVMMDKIDQLRAEKKTQKIALLKDYSDL